MKNENQIITQYNPDKKRWDNVRPGKDRVSSSANTKADAQEKGRDQAKRQNLEHVIKNMDGKIANRNSYGNDPFPPKG